MLGFLQGAAFRHVDSIGAVSHGDLFHGVNLLRMSLFNAAFASATNGNNRKAQSHTHTVRRGEQKSRLRILTATHSETLK